MNRGRGRANFVELDVFEEYLAMQEPSFHVSEGITVECAVNCWGHDLKCVAVKLPNPVNHPTVKVPLHLPQPLVAPGLGVAGQHSARFCQFDHRNPLRHGAPEFVVKLFVVEHCNDVSAKRSLDLEHPGLVQVGCVDHAPPRVYSLVFAAPLRSRLRHFGQQKREKPLVVRGLEVAKVVAQGAGAGWAVGEVHHPLVHRHAQRPRQSRDPIGRVKIDVHGLSSQASGVVDKEPRHGGFADRSLPGDHNPGPSLPSRRGNLPPSVERRVEVDVGRHNRGAARHIRVPFREAIDFDGAAVPAEDGQRREHVRSERVGLARHNFGPKNLRPT
eukprot:m.61258 g.61258  ORF g.61258 m.61258 type:complete len:329 (+) comp9547_c0_seq1:4574-5560(+)